MVEQYIRFTQKREQIKTPEKGAEGLYLDTLEKKRDTFLAFRAMNSFRKGRRFGEMSSGEIKEYETLREQWRSEKEKSLDASDNLPEGEQQKLAVASRNLNDVQAELVRLGRTEAPENTLNPENEAELQERQEAEANPDQTPPKGFLARVQKSFKSKVSEVETNVSDRINRVREIDELLKEKYRILYQEVSVIDRRPLEEEIRKLEKEKANLEKESLKQEEIAETAPESVLSEQETVAVPETIEPEPEQEPKKETRWSFLKERAKGLITPFGFREFRQAEIFRRETKDIGRYTKALATLIQQERNLGLEESQDEANEIVKILQEENIELPERWAYSLASDFITKRKMRENDNEIAYIAQTAEEEIERKLQKYRGEAGQDVLTEENRLAIRVDLTGELNKLRDGAFRKDFVNYAKLMRRNLDNKWNWRYVWGGIDAALWFLGGAMVSMKFLAGKEAVAVGAKLAAGGAGSAEAAREFVEKGMHENVWNTLKEMAKNGPTHMDATAAQLKEWSQVTLDAIKHYEPEWMEQMIEGLKSSRTMPEGFPLKIPAEVMKAMGYPG